MRIGLISSSPYLSCIRKIFFFLCLALCCPEFLYSEDNAADSITLKQAIEIAVRNSPEVLSAEQEVKLAKQRVRDAKFQFGPQIMLSGTASRFNIDEPMTSGMELGDRFFIPNYAEDPDFKNHYFTIRTQVLLPLYVGGRNVNNLKLAKVAYNRAKVAHSSLRSSKAFDVKKAYFKLQYVRHLLELTDRTFSELKASFENRNFSLEDKYEASLRSSRMEEKMRELAMKEETAVTEFLALISRDPIFSFSLKDAFDIIPVNDTLQQCIVAASEYRAELQNEIFQAQTDQIAVNMSILRNYPTITLGAVYDINSSNFSDLSDKDTYGRNWLTMVSVRLPISFNSWSPVSQSRIQQRQGELKRVEIRDAIRMEIKGAYRDVLFWENENAILSAELEKAEKMYSEIIAKSVNPVSAAKYSVLLYDLRSSVLKSVYGQLEARARLEWARGLDFADR